MCIRDSVSTVKPSGRLPSDLNKPEGSLVTGVTTDNVIITGIIITLRLMLLFAKNFLGGPEVLDLQFRNPQEEPYTLCLRKKGPPWNTLELSQILTDFQNVCTAGIF